MHSMLTMACNGWRRSACAALAVLVCGFLAIVSTRVLANAVGAAGIIQVLFGDSLQTGGLDVNDDGVLTVADVVPGVLFAGTIADIVPHSLNDELVYRITDPSGAVTIQTTTVTNVGDNGSFTLLDHETQGQVVLINERQSYVDTGVQLLYTGVSDDVAADYAVAATTTCDPPLIRLELPLLVGRMTSTSTHCETKTTDNGIPIGFLDRIDTFTPIEITDSITVPAGTFTQVVHVSGATNMSGEPETDDFYFKPGVGIILQLQVFGGYTTRHELVSGTIGGVPVGQ